MAIQFRPMLDVEHFCIFDKFFAETFLMEREESRCKRKKFGFQWHHNEAPHITPSRH
jgi:hypothetical protein